MARHVDVIGEELTPERIVGELSTEALTELMGLCHTEPAEPRECVCCAAYMEVCRREAEGE